MYKLILRPLLFQLYPETVHHLIVGLIKFLFKIPGISFLFRQIFNSKAINLEKEVFGLKFKNPVGLAAGFDKNGTFYNEFASFGFSFIELGTITPMAQPGNEKPRSFRLPKDKAIINRMGFNNLGADQMALNLKKRKTDIVVGGNIGKNTATSNDNANDDYISTFVKLYDSVDYFVINISCPNIKDLTKLQNKDSLLVLMQLLAKERKEKQEYKPILIKIAPDLGFNQIDDILEIIDSTKMDGIVATNTSVNRDGLMTNKSIIEQIGSGGLSGKPLKDRSTEVIRYIHQKTNGKLPIIGVGGIMTPQDALEKLNAGASLIQIYTGFIYEGPAIVKKINKYLSKHL